MYDFTLNILPQMEVKDIFEVLIEAKIEKVRTHTCKYASFTSNGIMMYIVL